MTGKQDNRETGRPECGRPAPACGDGAHEANPAEACGGALRFPTVHIVSVDYACQILTGEDGREYYELPDSSWIAAGPVVEGSVRYWGSGSHAGHINLLPLAYYENGQWVSV